MVLIPISWCKLIQSIEMRFDSILFFRTRIFTDAHGLKKTLNSIACGEENIRLRVSTRKLIFRRQADKQWLSVFIRANPCPNQ